MLNHITIMGRLTRDPELRRTGSGIAVTSFSVAVDRDYKSGSEKEVDFIDCVAWRQTGEFVGKYFTKGRMIVVSGKLQTRTWTDKDGNKRKATEVVADNCYFGDSKSESQNAQSTPNPYVQAAFPAPGYASPASAGYAPPAGGYSAPSGYSTPSSGFALLDDEDAQLPF